MTRELIDLVRFSCDLCLEGSATLEKPEDVVKAAELFPEGWMSVTRSDGSKVDVCDMCVDLRNLKDVEGAA